MFGGKENLGLLMRSEVEGGSERDFCKTAFIWVFYIGNTEKCHFLALFCHFEHFNVINNYDGC